MYGLRRVDLALVSICALLVGACGDENAATDIDSMRDPASTGDGAATGERATTTPSGQDSTRRSARSSRTAWRGDVILSRIHGVVVRVDGRRVRLDAATVTCGGIGRPITRVRSEPAWGRFRCLQPTFPAGTVAGPDAVLVIEPTGRRTFEVVDRWLTRY
jgi:hypothetical protein